jgi:hypothetical protein
MVMRTRPVWIEEEIVFAFMRTVKNPTNQAKIAKSGKEAGQRF